MKPENIGVRIVASDDKILTLARKLLIVFLLLDPIIIIS